MRTFECQICAMFRPKSRQTEQPGLRKHAHNAHNHAFMERDLSGERQGVTKGGLTVLRISQPKKGLHLESKAQVQGPLQIKQVISPVDYRITLPEGWKIYDIVHAFRLSKWDSGSN